MQGTYAFGAKSNTAKGNVMSMLGKNKIAPHVQSYLDSQQADVQRKLMTGPIAYNAPLPPAPPPPPEHTAPLISAEEKKNKNKYIIGDTKEEIVNNIINKKASVNNVRNALQKYAEIIMEEDLF